MMHDLWVFGYGSLMWRPGFTHEEKQPARLHGYHRSLCVFSYVHRGTPEAPGLVFGLDAGGACRGMAFRVRAQDAPDVRAYLREREQITMVYREITHPLRLLDGSGRKVAGLCYAVDRAHVQYAGRLDLAAQVRLVLQGRGRSGANPDYLGRTVRHLDDMGIRDRGLHRLWQAVTAAQESSPEA